MKPRLFDVRASDVPTAGVPVLKPWKRITLDPDWAGAWIIAGDIDNDGEVEILSARNVNADDVHHTCSVIAYNLDGTVLWRWGNPAEGRNILHHDVACQIHDWDNDGNNEVVLITKDSVISLDGKTGLEKHRFAIPQDASDCLVFADLTGRGHASEILVKDRYKQIWAFSYDGDELWNIERPAGEATAHQPRVMDIDRDGKDEIMAGFALLNPNGTVRWDLRTQDLPIGTGHLDTARLFHQGDTPEDTLLAMTLCTAFCVAMIDGTGNTKWKVSGHHFESIDVGKVCADVPGDQVVVDIDRAEDKGCPLWVISDQGEFLGRIFTDGSRHHRLVDWFGQGLDSIVLGTAAALFDGRGNKTAVFDVDNNTDIGMCDTADMTGNGIPDLIFSSNPGEHVYIFRNDNGKLPSPPHPLGTGNRKTLY